MNKLNTTLLALGLLAAGSAVIAAPYGKGNCDGAHSHYAGKHGAMGMERDGTRMLERMSETLDLSPEQQTAVKAIFETYRPQLTALADEQRQSRKRLRELKRQYPIDNAELEQLAKAQGDQLTRRILLRSQMRQEINAILTQEQREKRNELRRQRRSS